MSLKLDANGNIRPEYLEKELQAALEHDLKYQQTDNMKKRAIKTAQSYDEFKNMVACAHLKTLSRQEIDSLKDVKKGWKKKPESSSEASILQQELTAAPTASSITTTTFKPPKNMMMLERDWRRLSTEEEKQRYLLKVGLKKIIKALQHDSSAELLEQIISTILSSPTATTTDTEAAAIDILKWLIALADIDRFSLNLRFFDKSLTQRILEYLNSANADQGVIEKYSLVVSPTKFRC